MSTTNILKLRRAESLPAKALVYVVDESSGDKDAKNLAIYASDLVAGAEYIQGARPIGTIGGAIDDATQKAANAAQKDELAAPTGAAEVGSDTDGGTLQEVADNAKPMANYTALRAYAGRATTVRITSSGIAGSFRLDTGDTTSADNGGTIIVGAAGRRWKRQFDGEAPFGWFEMVADWNGSTGTNNGPKLAAMIADTQITKIVGQPGAFWFGAIANNEVRFPVTRPIQFDFGGADIKVTGVDVAGNTGSAFLSFIDVPTAAGNYTFEDTSFNIDTSVGRGVIPVLIRAAATSTFGHSVGPCRVIKGQSIYTCISDAPLTARSQSIALVGGCYGDSVYYGINLANNGDTVSGVYRLGRSHRALFAYGVNGADVNFICDSAPASSANLLISASGTGFPATTNIKVRAEFSGLNGPLVICDQPVADGSGVYANIVIDLIVKSIGSNLNAGSTLVAIGAYASNGTYLTTEKTVAMDGIAVNLYLDPALAAFDSPVQVFTPSPNYGRLSLNEKCQANLSALFPKNASGVYMGPVLEKSAKFIRAVAGDLTNVNAVVFIPSKYLAAQSKNSNVCAKVRAVGRNGVGSGSFYTVSDFIVIGDLSGAGVFRFVSATQVGTAFAGTACTFAFSLAAGGAGLNITANTYTQTFSLLTAYVEP